MTNDMRITDISAIDPTHSMLCDLFLAFLGTEKNADYSRFKNCVLLSALTDEDIPSVYAAVAVADSCNATDVARSVTDVIDCLPEPINVLFNKYYCEGAKIGFMPDLFDSEEIVSFLGTTFLYLLLTNYR